MIAGIGLRPRLRVVGCPKDIEKRLLYPLAAAAGAVREEARTILGIQGPSSSPGAGWPTYFNPELKAYVKASEPPAAPHRQTGKLQDSVVRKSLRKTEMAVVATAPYAFDLEYGKNRKRGPRPFMVPALTRSIGKILRSFTGFLGIK